MSRLPDADWEVLRETVGAQRAVELLEVMGLRIGLRDLGEARRHGRVTAIKVGDVWRFDPEELARFADAEIEARWRS